MPSLIGNIDLDLSKSNSDLVDQVVYPIHQIALHNYAIGKSNVSIDSGLKNNGSYLDQKIAVLYWGVLLNLGCAAENTAADLHKRYSLYGEQFVNDLRGSFQIVVIDGRCSSPRFLIYSDQIASRQVFYASTTDDFFFSNHIEPLISRTQTKTEDKMAMVHFMVSGHFPSGHTAIKEINILGPGEYIAVQAKSIQVKRYFQFNILPNEAMNDREASRKLDDVLTDRIIAHWHRAEEPAILLSGGYDSQYIFFTIAESVEDTSKLRTVTWGQDPSKINSDMAVARRTAKRFGTRHTEVVKTLDFWRSGYEEMFKAQNGLTDSSFYHANELTVVKNLRNEYGIKSVIRGDECFGYGASAHTVQNALIPNSMSYPGYVVDMSYWFICCDYILEQYSEFMTELVDKYQCESYNSLKDTLDFYERQHMNRNPLNYFKLPYLEVFCPLIDADVLTVIQNFPSKFRCHKILFKQLLRKKFGKYLEVSEYTNLTDWEEVFSSSSQYVTFFNLELANLPSFFNIEYFRSLNASLQNYKGKDFNSKIRTLARSSKRYLPVEMIRNIFEYRKRFSDQYHKIPLHILVIRAAVLARWNDWWIASK